MRIQDFHLVIRKISEVNKDRPNKPKLKTLLERRIEKLQKEQEPWKYSRVSDLGVDLMI